MRQILFEEISVPKGKSTINILVFEDTREVFRCDISHIEAEFSKYIEKNIGIEHLLKINNIDEYRRCVYLHGRIKRDNRLGEEAFGLILKRAINIYEANYVAIKRKEKADCHSCKIKACCYTQLTLSKIIIEEVSESRLSSGIFDDFYTLLYKYCIGHKRLD